MKINRSGRQSESTSAEVLCGWDAHEANLSVFPRLGSATTDGRSAVKHREPRQCRDTHTFAHRYGNWGKLQVWHRKFCGKLRVPGLFLRTSVSGIKIHIFVCKLPVSSSVSSARCQYSWALTVYTSSEASRTLESAGSFL